MTNDSIIEVATLNTFFGKTLRESDGLNSVIKTDILLLQEVYSPKADKLDVRLKQKGFKLICYGGHFGLAIALHLDSSIQFIDGSIREEVFQKISPRNIKSTTRYAGRELDYTDRGILSAKFKTQQGLEFTASSTHLPVVTKPRKRADFIKQLITELKDSYYRGTLILAGDMNHYPGPKSIDYKFREVSKLNAVDLGGKHTWPSKDAESLERKVGRFYRGQFDDVLYRGKNIKALKSKVVDIRSDHRGVIATFRIGS